MGTTARLSRLAPAAGTVLAPAPAPAPGPSPAPSPSPSLPRSPVAPPTVDAASRSGFDALQRTIKGRTVTAWLRLWGLGFGGLVVAAGILVLAARGVTTLPGVPDFLRQYRGSYDPAVASDPGFPPWARWAHFFNFFVMVLIIRSGLLVRHQQRPPAFFTPARRGGKKISIYSWLHTSLDLLWVANGVIFVVLLFVSGHWVRIIPTSWEVFPHAASAALQYATLEWPVEDGWVNYNALQQLMYALVIFVAAPLAAVTGVRLSQWWPSEAEKLNKAYPIDLARAVHYPTMLFFVLFIVAHVTLVFATGALRNLNHMYAGSPEVSWVGFAWFVAGLLVTAGATLAARPIVLTPVASLFGKVSQR